MGVTMQGGAIAMLYNPEFVVSCNLAKLVGVLPQR